MEHGLLLSYLSCTCGGVLSIFFFLKRTEKRRNAISKEVQMKRLLMLATLLFLSWGLLCLVIWGLHRLLGRLTTLCLVFLLGGGLIFAFLKWISTDRPSKAEGKTENEVLPIGMISKN